MTPARALVAMVSVPSAQAAALARSLVEHGRAACVQQLPGVQSVYRWQGRVCSDEETLLLIKTTPDGFETLRQVVLAQHPHEVPEIIALPIDHAHPAYLQWLLQESAPRSSD